jgi:branched-chain amino acid transport system substrate-binding protein
VIVSQVVPFPWDASIKVVADYQAAQRLIDAELDADFVSLEGYLSGRLAATALELAGPNPTRAGLLRIIDQVGQFDISGDRLAVGHKAHDAAAEVFLTLIRGDGTFAPINRM